MKDSEGSLKAPVKTSETSKFILDPVLKVIDKISETTGHIVASFIAIITVVVLYEIISRYIFNKPTVWAFEVTWMLCGSLLVLLPAWAEKLHGHVNVDVLYLHFPRKGKQILDLVLTLVLALPFIIVILYSSTIYAMNSWEIKEHTSTIFRPPLYPLVTTIPIGFFLLLLAVLAQMIRGIRSMIKGGDERGI